MKAVWGDGGWEAITTAAVRKATGWREKGLGCDTLLKSPLVKWWLGEACGETLFSGELLRKHGELTSRPAFLSNPELLLHTVTVCQRTEGKGLS